MTPTAVEVCALQLYSAVAAEVGLRRCRRCGRVFSRQRGRARHDDSHRRNDAQYCSKRCAQSAAAAAYRGRQGGLTECPSAVTVKAVSTRRGMGAGAAQSPCPAAPSRGVSAGRIVKIHRVSSRALKTAQRWGLVERNVAELVSPPRQEVREMDFLTREEVKRLVGTARGTPDEATWLLALLGLRQG